MFEFDLSKISADIAQLLMTNGTGTRPIEWKQQRNHLAKKLLDDCDDVILFEILRLKSTEMAEAVKALLFLWGGWPVEAVKLARSAGQAEKLYITALCERQLGHTDLAKQLFQAMGTHPIFQQLAEYILKSIRPGGDEALKQIKDLIESNEGWEPLAIIDFYEQARLAKISPVAREAISNMQTKEFELLFGYCYENATGKSIAKRRLLSEAEEKRREEEHKHYLAERRMAPQRKPNKSSNTTSRKNNTPKSDGKVRILCPYCRTMALVMDAKRGQKHQCIKCGAFFLVPNKKQTIVRHFAEKK